MTPATRAFLRSAIIGLQLLLRQLYEQLEDHEEDHQLDESRLVITL